MSENSPSYKKDNLNNNSNSYSKNGIIMDPETKIKYKKGKKIGGGGFGEVYEFIELETNKKRAVKIISNSRIDNDPQSNTAYNNEYKFNTCLDFKYLCKCFSTFKDNQNAYFILDYQPNKTLSELLLKRQHLSEIEIKHYGFELLLAIEYLHKRNIIHRDIKLSNVLLSEKMEVRLCDFGLAIDNGIEYQKNICGTPNYIAPELLNHKNGLKYSFEVDIWAFAVLLYTLYFNKTPFEEKAKGKTKYNIQNILYTFPKEVPISKEAKDLISSILVKNPNERPKIDEIKASSFFKNGEGIPKYLPVSTLVRAMSQEEEESFVKKAILNEECLDKEVNIAKNISFSMRTKYYSIENNDQNENISNYSASYSSSSEEGDNKDENNKNINNLILKNESNNENIINIKNINNNDNKNNNNLNSNQIIYNREKEAFTSFANNDNKSNISRDEEISKLGKFSTNLTSNKNILNYYNNSKSFGKMNETAGFISNNMSNSNSEFFASTTKIRDKDNSNLIPDDLNNVEEVFKINSKFNINKKISQNLMHQNYNEINIILNNTHSSRSNSYKSGNINNNDIISKEINNVIISKFIDLSDKCGVGYILSNGDVGVHFNDGTKMIRIKCTLNFIYLDNQGKITLINTKKKVDNKDYETKINALLLFNKTFIKNSKFRKSFDVDPKLHKKNIDLYVKKWVKSQFAYFFLLSNEKVQVIFDDKSQVIFDFQSKKTIYINKSKQMTIQNINTTNFGNEEMNKRVKYAKKILGKL